MVPWLTINDPFPDPQGALREPNGLLAVGADLSVPRLLNAYRNGIFPWFNAGEPVLWWSPAPRMVLRPTEFICHRSLRQRLRRGDFQVTLDQAFGTVMHSCAAPTPQRPGTWIVPAMQAAYTRLHHAGYAHSVEVWQNGALAGGLYGVALGRAFFGESMFSRVSDASKVALAFLAAQLARWQFPLIDCQMETAHLASLGARPWPRDTFLAKLNVAVTQPPPVPWRFASDIAAELAQ